MLAQKNFVKKGSDLSSLPQINADDADYDLRHPRLSVAEQLARLGFGGLDLSQHVVAGQRP